MGEGAQFAHRPFSTHELSEGHPATPLLLGCPIKFASDKVELTILIGQTEL